jgi:hypothetical protein
LAVADGEIEGGGNCKALKLVAVVAASNRNSVGFDSHDVEEDIQESYSR